VTSRLKRKLVSITNYSSLWVNFNNTKKQPECSPYDRTRNTSPVEFITFGFSSPQARATRPRRRRRRERARTSPSARTWSQATREIGGRRTFPTCSVWVPAPTGSTRPTENPPQVRRRLHAQPVGGLAKLLLRSLNCNSINNICHTSLDRIKISLVILTDYWAL